MKTMMRSLFAAFSLGRSPDSHLNLSATIGATVARQILSGSLYFAGMCITARMLGPAGNGILATAMLLPQALYAFLNLGMGASHVYHLSSGSGNPRQMRTANWILAVVLWMAVVLVLLAGSEQPCNINRLSEEELLISRWRFCDELLVEADSLYPKELADLRAMQGAFVARRLATPFICKTHDRFDTEVTGLPGSRSLYLVRDPRDVAISLSHHAGISIDAAIARKIKFEKIQYEKSGVYGKQKRLLILERRISK